MEQYIEGLRQILDTGVDREGRNRRNSRTVRHANAIQSRRRVPRRNHQKTRVPVQ